ncbi:MAG: GNAT family N-acetyltransferase [Actinobacteria bacterium]|nr:GNAT family N-acetyltransferase [Actinomycetota bacterium]
MELLEIDRRLSLRPVADGDAEPLYGLIEGDRERLARWLPWAAEQTLAGTREFVAKSRAQQAREDGFQAVLLRDGVVAGIAGYHCIDRLNRATSIGYWLAARHQGEGLMTAAVRALVDHAFGSWGLNRVAIEAAVANRRSRAIPERLGFTEEGVLRESELIAGRFLDGVLYSMLAAEWAARR